MRSKQRLLAGITEQLQIGGAYRAVVLICGRCGESASPRRLVDYVFVQSGGILMTKRRGRRRSWTDKELKVAVANSTSIRDVQRHLGLSVLGNPRTIYRYIRLLELDTSHFTSARGWGDSTDTGAMSELWNTYRHHARTRGLIWELTKTEFRRITSSTCFYCGCVPNHRIEPAGWNAKPYIYNGVDRRDNAEGYTVNNVVSCCDTCNSAKLVKTEQEFATWIIAAYHRFARGYNEDS